jgi:hypothetical protein
VVQGVSPEFKIQYSKKKKKKKERKKKRVKSNISYICEDGIFLESHFLSLNKSLVSEVKKLAYIKHGFSDFSLSLSLFPSSINQSIYLSIYLPT